MRLEFGSGWMLPSAVDEDVTVLACDIVTLSDYEPLDQCLERFVLCQPASESVQF
jgi:hypothetical protein